MEVMARAEANYVTGQIRINGYLKLCCCRGVITFSKYSVRKSGAEIIAARSNSVLKQTAIMKAKRLPIRKRTFCKKPVGVSVSKLVRMFFISTAETFEAPTNFSMILEKGFQ